jgi:hypothetical protein
MRGVRRRRSLQVVATGEAFGLKRRAPGHDELGAGHRPRGRIRSAVDDVAASL